MKRSGSHLQGRPAHAGRNGNSVFIAKPCFRCDPLGTTVFPLEGGSISDPLVPQPRPGRCVTRTCDYNLATVDHTGSSLPFHWWPDRGALRGVFPRHDMQFDYGRISPILGTVQTVTDPSSPFLTLTSTCDNHIYNHFDPSPAYLFSPELSQCHLLRRNVIRAGLCRNLNVSVISHHHQP
jgi:hypothetical protein